MAIVILEVKVKPRSRRSGLDQLADGTWVARLKAPPVDGKASAELVTLIAERFRRPRASVSIRAGASSRRKIVRVDTGD